MSVRLKLTILAHPCMLSLALQSGLLDIVLVFHQRVSIFIRILLNLNNLIERLIVALGELEMALVTDVEIFQR